MKKFLLLLIIGLLTHSINAQTIIGQSPAKAKSQKTGPFGKAGFKYSIIPSLNNTWGYDIYIGEQLFIHQLNKPGLPGNEGFKAKEGADKAAQLVIKKLRNRFLSTPGSVKSPVLTPGNWVQKANYVGNARIGLVGFSIGSKGYFGTGEDIAYFNDFWEYDPSANTWTQKADFGGGPRSQAVGFSIGNKGYIGTGAGIGIINRKDFWQYDPVSNSWTQKANFGGTARNSAVGFGIGNKGYIGTGFDITINPTGDFWEYDPASDVWTRKADFAGAARDNAVGFSIGNLGYIGTGFGNLPIIFKNDFWEYNPSTDLWTRKADFGGAGRSYATGFSIGTRGYIGTGYNQPPPDNDLKDFWEYDPSADSWTQKADFSGCARIDASGFSIGNRGYIGTGTGHILPGVYNDFWEFNPSCTLPNAPTNTTPAGNQLICSGNFTTLSASGTGTLGWYNAPTGGTWLGGGSTFITSALFASTTFYVQDSTCDASATRTSIPVTVNQPQIPTITGQTNMCVNSGYYTYSTETGMNGYQWNISVGGNIIFGQGTNVVQAIWNQAGNQWIDVTYTNATGCTATIPTILSIMVDPLPAPAGPILGSSVVCVDSEGVGYETDSIANAATYVWTVPAGATITSGFGTRKISVTFNDSMSSGIIQVYGNNLCGNGDISPQFHVQVNPLPPRPVINEKGDTLISSAPFGNQWFYNGILLVNDTGQTYLVSPYLPGYYWTQVTLNGCVSDTSNHIYCSSVAVNEQQELKLSMYPNPGTDILSIVFNKANDNSKFIEIYELSGKKVFESQTRERKIIIRTNNYPSGIYFIKLKTRDSVFIEKFCKN
jgi:N-acetylneuraminic acid mutarotase